MQGINGTTIYAEIIYKTNLTEPNKKFTLSSHYNGDNSYLFVNGVEQLKFKAQSFTDDIKQEIFMYRKYIVRLELNKFNKNWIIWKCL